MPPPTSAAARNASQQYKRARVLSDQLLAYITTASASGTLEDIRRWAGGGTPRNRLFPFCLGGAGPGLRASLGCLKGAAAACI